MTDLEQIVHHLSLMTAKLDDEYGFVLSVRQAGSLYRAADELVTRTNHLRMAKVVEEVAQTQDTYISCLGMSQEQFGALRLRGAGKRGQAAEMGALVALWADVDISGPGHASGNYPVSLEEALGIIDPLPKPSLIVFTGGGYHAWWMLPSALILEGDTVARELASTSARRWVSAIASAAERAGGWSIDPVGDLSRVLRIAGTTSFKNDPPADVSVLER